MSKIIKKCSRAISRGSERRFGGSKRECPIQSRPQSRLHKPDLGLTLSRLCQWEWLVKRLSRSTAHTLCVSLCGGRAPITPNATRSLAVSNEITRPASKCDRSAMYRIGLVLPPRVACMQFAKQRVHKGLLFVLTLSALGSKQRLAIVGCSPAPMMHRAHLYPVDVCSRPDPYRRHLSSPLQIWQLLNPTPDTSTWN